MGLNFNFSIKWLVDDNTYLSGMEGLITESKNFASLYSGVSIMLTTGHAELFILWTLTRTIFSVY